MIKSRSGQISHCRHYYALQTTTKQWALITKSLFNGVLMTYVAKDCIFVTNRRSDSLYSGMCHPSRAGGRTEGRVETLLGLAK